MAGKEDKKTKVSLNLNLLLCLFLALTLISYWLNFFPFLGESVLKIVAFSSTLTVFYGAFLSLKNRRISIDLLAGIALFFSLVQGEWVSAIFINLMIASARAFTNYVKIKSHSAIDSLMKFKPQRVKILVEGKALEIPVEKIKKGDRVIINLGEAVPVDGIIEEGQASIDQSSLTGESEPVFRKKGEKVLSFTTVVSGNLIIRAERVGRETTFEKIVSLVEKSQMNKARVFTLIDGFANWYIILTILGSLLVYLLFKDVNLVLGLLLVSCADDIAIATPLAMMSAITHSAREGAIVKGGDFLEGMANVKTVVFDKTGTLTKGKFEVKKILSFNGKEENEVLKLAAVASSGSHHPISQAIVRYAKERNIEVGEPGKLGEYSGKGITAFFEDRKIIIGRLTFFQEKEVKMTEEQSSAIKKELSAGFNSLLVGYDGELIGFVVLADELRPNVRETISELKKLGVKKTVMLTGDNERIARKVAREVGIDEFNAELLPAEKTEYFKTYLNDKYKVAMVGDGVNDAPVLALSDIGIAMGAIGSDAAVEAADIAMMNDDLSQIPELVRIGRAAMRVIRQNLAIWAVLNIVGFALVFLRFLDPPGAATYNFITDFIPILNSLRLFR